MSDKKTLWGQTLVEVDLTVAECELILSLLEALRLEGSPYGNRAQHIEDKINASLEEL